MDIQFGLETEIGIQRDRPEWTDVVADSIALVRSTREPGVRARWDYSSEDPHRDARGFRVKELRQDADEASYFAQDASRPLSFVEMKSDLVLCNGARFYNDHSHPEYCMPECATLRDLVEQDRAGDELLMDCAAAVNAGSDNPVRLYKNNTDFRGHTYGCHENYLLPRRLPWDRLVAGMQAFLATRQIFAGAGKYGREAEDRFVGPGFQISQRSDFFSELQSVDTMQRRPLINTRDEPHADTEKYRRFHVIVGDSNLSPYATYLKVGTTALVLQALVNGVAPERVPRLSDPLGALRSVSLDPEWRWPLTLADGRPASAVDVQRTYRGLVRAAAPPADPDWKALLDAWGAVLDDLERDPAGTADRVDWAAKHRLLERFREAEKIAADDPWLHSLDLSYHLLDRTDGLFHGLLDSGAIRRPFPASESAWRGLRAPTSTRAALRGACIEKFGGEVESTQWEAVVIRDGRRRIEVDLRDLFSAEDIRRGCAAVAAARSPADLLVLPFAKAL